MKKIIPKNNKDCPFCRGIAGIKNKAYNTKIAIKIGLASNLKFLFFRDRYRQINTITEKTKSLAYRESPINTGKIKDGMKKNRVKAVVRIPSEKNRWALYPSIH